MIRTLFRSAWLWNTALTFATYLPVSESAVTLHSTKLIHPVLRPFLLIPCETSKHQIYYQNSIGNYASFDKFLIPVRIQRSKTRCRIVSKITADCLIIVTVVKPRRQTSPCNSQWVVWHTFNSIIRNQNIIVSPLDHRVSLGRQVYSVSQRTDIVHAIMIHSNSQKLITVLLKTQKTLEKVAGWM